MTETTDEWLSVGRNAFNDLFPRAQLEVRLMEKVHTPWYRRLLSRHDRLMEGAEIYCFRATFPTRPAVEPFFLDVAREFDSSQFRNLFEEKFGGHIAQRTLVVG